MAIQFRRLMLFCVFNVLLCALWFFLCPKRLIIDSRLIAILFHMICGTSKDSNKYALSALLFIEYKKSYGDIIETYHVSYMRTRNSGTCWEVQAPFLIFVLTQCRVPHVFSFVVQRRAPTNDEDPDKISSIFLIQT